MKGDKEDEKEERTKRSRRDKETEDETKKGASNSHTDREGNVQRVWSHTEEPAVPTQERKLYLISLNLPQTHSQSCAGEVSLGIPMLNIER